MPENLISNNDVVIGANEPIRPGGSVDDSGGDIILRTGGVERARIKADGTGSGWPSILGGSMPVIDAGNDVVIGNGTSGFASRTSGTQNVAVGVGAAVGLTSAGANVALGYQALNSLTDGNAVGSGGTGQNVAIGAQALYVNNSRWNIAVGSYALMNTTGNENVAVGAGAGQAITTGVDNTAIGHNAMWGGASSFPITNAQPITGTQNVAVGSYALQCQSASLTGSNNVAIGFKAMYVATSDTDNIAIGSNTLLNQQTAQFNIAVGSSALKNNTSGGNNVAVGYQALQAAQAMTSQVAVGYQALTNVNGGTGYNIGIGRSAGASSTFTSGANNVFIGRDAGNTDGTTATSNVNSVVCLGWQAQATTDKVIVLGSAITANRHNLVFGTAGTSAAVGGGVGVFAIASASTLPTANNTAGGILYVDAGALKWRGSGGTITTLGLA